MRTLIPSTALWLMMRVTYLDEYFSTSMLHFQNVHAEIKAFKAHEKTRGRGSQDLERVQALQLPIHHYSKLLQSQNR